MHSQYTRFRHPAQCKTVADGWQGREASRETVANSPLILQAENENWPVRKNEYISEPPAPPPGEGAVGQEEIGRVEVENFVIDGVPHRAQNLQGAGDVKVREGFDYAVVKIWRHSMRLSNIHDGDYALVRVQEAASHGDIALIVKHGADTEATLKGYLERNPGEVLLIPHSDQLDPKTGEPYAPIPIGEKDGVRVFGIAIAVFKPI